MCVNPHRLLDLQTFAAEAREAGAVVLNTLHAELGDNGFLQAYLEQKEVQVLHTGSDSQVTALCHDKVYTAKPWTTSCLLVASATGGLHLLNTGCKGCSGETRLVLPVPSS